MTITIPLVIMVVVAYLIGNISPSITISKSKGIDIKNEGSGNAGTTNMLRVVGKRAAVLTLIVDILKGTLAVVLGGVIAGDFAAMLCALAVLCGHVWPAFHKFKGGKGVATAFGTILGINPVLAFLALGIVALVVLISRRMSLGSIVGAAAFPVLSYFMEPNFTVISSIMALIIIFKHRTNIVRLVKGQEPKLKFKKK